MEKDISLCSRIASHLVEMITTTAIDDTPCQHAMLSGVFPEEVYQYILGHIPAQEAFRPMSLELFHDDKGMSTRDLIELPDIGVERIAPELQSFWWAVGMAIMSADVKSAVFNGLAEDLAPVFGCATSEVDDQSVFVRGFPR